MGIQQIISIMYLETVDDLTELIYVFGIYIVVCFKLIGLILNRDKLASTLDGLKGCNIDGNLFWKIYSPKFSWIEKQMLPSNHLYHDEYVKTVRHIRLISRVFTCVMHTGLLAQISSTIWDQKRMFFCYFPFETRYAYSLQG